MTVNTKEANEQSRHPIEKLRSAKLVKKLHVCTVHHQHRNILLSNLCTIIYIDTIKSNIIKYLKVLQHVSDHRGSLVQCLAKITRMVLSCPLTWTWSVLWQHIVTFLDIELHKHTHTNTSGYKCCHNTDLVHINGHDRTILVFLAK